MKNSGEKKKKSLLFRIIKIAAIVFVLFFLLDVFLDDDDTEYISEQEQMLAARAPKASQDEMLNMFYDWYGFLPDDEYDDYYFMDDDYYDYDFDDYGYDYDDFYGYDDWDWDTYDYEWDDDDYAWLDDLFDWDDDDDEYAYDWDDDDDDSYDWDDDWKRRDDKKKDDKKKDDKKRKGDKKDDGILPNIDVGGSEKRKLFLARANGFMGTPYAYGGTSHSGVDCSGLVYCAAKEAGIGVLPRSSSSLYSMAKKIDRNNAIAGDLVFFATGSSISHVAIYLGDNQVLHAVSDGSKTGVITSKLTEKYWKNHYHSMGKIFDD